MLKNTLEIYPLFVSNDSAKSFLKCSVLDVLRKSNQYILISSCSSIISSICINSSVSARWKNGFILDKGVNFEKF